MEALPFIALYINCTLRDLLHPGLPTINIGTLLLIATNSENIFSNKARFFEIPFPISTFLIINSFSKLIINNFYKMVLSYGIIKDMNHSEKNGEEIKIKCIGTSERYFTNTKIDN